MFCCTWCAIICLCSCSSSCSCIIKLSPLTNCVWGPNEWSPCSSATTCDGINPTRPGTRTRTFTVTTPSANGGLACPSSLTETGTCAKDCSVNCVGSWSIWGACNATCINNNLSASGSRTRTFTVTTPMANGGLACPSSLTETGTCIKTDCPRDCSGNYSAWTDTSNNPVCPSSTNYSISDNSFNIIKNRSRRFDISQNALNGGICPQTDISNTSGIYIFNCPRDCSGNWSSWSDCSANTGIRTVSYTHLTLPTNREV